MNIVVNVLDPKSIDDAIKKLEYVDKACKEALEVVSVQLAQLGIRIMRTQFNLVTAIQHLKAEDTPQVHIGLEKDKVIIELSGEKLGFIEFGTGDDVHTSHPSASRVPYPVAPGSWSQSQGKGHYPPRWYYNGERLTGTIAADAIPKAMAVMEARLQSIAKETFEKLVK